MKYQILCKRIKSWGKEPLIHAILWILFICGEVFSLATLTGGYSSLENYVFFYLLNIVLFYSYVWLLFKIPQDGPAIWFWLLVIFIAILALYVTLAGILTDMLKISSKGNPIEISSKKFIVSTCWRGVYFMLFATGFVLLKRNSKRRMNELAKIVEIERLQAQLISAEKDFLRSQINPHLLFNTLSFINHATKHHPEKARQALGLLSDIMDYALDSNKGEFVLLSEEVQQIENMIVLNQLRFGDRLNLVFTVSSNCEDIKISPIILLTLAENVFKHGNLLHKTQQTRFELTCVDQTIVFKTSNPAGNIHLTRGTCTGLKNIEARLKIVYPDKHSFNFGRQDNLFNTSLTIKT